MFTPFAFYKGGIAFDADAQAYITEVLAQGGTLSATLQNAINDFYLGLKSDGLYTKVLYMFPFLGATANAHAVSGVFPGNINHTITWFASLTSAANHTSNGPSTLSANGYGNVPVRVSDHAAVNDLSLGFYQVAGTVNDQGFVIATQTNTITSNRYQLNTPYDSNNVYYYVGGTVTGPYSNSSGYTSQMWVGSSLGSTATTYLNGTSVATSSITGALKTNTICFFTADQANTNSVSFTGTAGFIWGGDGLTGTEVSNLTSRVQTLMTAAGR